MSVEKRTYAIDGQHGSVFGLRAQPGDRLLNVGGGQTDCFFRRLSLQQLGEG